jgi:hypothetical protein
MNPVECIEHGETFWTLFSDIAHWEFELFLMVLFDGLIGALAWPFLKRYWNRHHKHDDSCDPRTNSAPYDPCKNCTVFGCDDNPKRKV